MKKIQILAATALIATIFVLALTLGDFLALSDIRNEYVSLDIIETLGVELSTDLPGWTATAGEWAMVQFSYVTRLAFLGLNLVTISLFIAFMRRQRQNRQVPV